MIDIVIIKYKYLFFTKKYYNLYIFKNRLNYIYTYNNENKAYEQNETIELASKLFHMVYDLFF